MTRPRADPPAGTAHAIEARGIVKRYGDLLANDHVDLTVARGDIHALLGENGAGKTTLMRVLYGLAVADAGTVAVDGRRVEIRSPRDAIAAGIGMVTQHFSLVGPMSVAENVVLGHTDGFRVDLAAARRRVTEVSERFGVPADPAAIVADLSVGQRQRVEILKALSRDCRVLVLDEPTAVLVPQEVDALFATLDRLRSGGMSVVFISHKLREVMALTDRVTVLRGGRVAGTVATAATDEDALAEMMVGRAALRPARPAGGRAGAPVLIVRGLSAAGRHGLPALREVSFELRAGEIVAVAGVSGNGQTELGEVLSGMRRATAGSARAGDTELADTPPDVVMRAGVGRIPEDRDASVVGEFSVAYNLVLEQLNDFRRGTVLDERRIRARAQELIERFSIKAGPDDRVATLSGGNVQKVLLARVLARDPQVLVVAQPTRGLDVGATQYVRSQLVAQRDRGAGVLLISEDLDEILALADRILVLYEGRVAGEVDGAAADRQRLGLMMAGRAAA